MYARIQSFSCTSRGRQSVIARVLNAKMEAEKGYKHVLAGDGGKKPRGEI